jgi:serpin B
MTLNGAVGTTFDEIRNTLGFGSMSLDQINEGYRDLMDLLLSLDPSVEMGIGNSVWYREGFPVRGDFVQRTLDYFDAEISALDFSSPDAAPTINAWVNAETQGRISEIVEDPIDRETVMFLINAVYFKGSWTHRFPEDRTLAATFSNLDGTTPQVSLMRLDDELLYAETETYQAVDLPYGGKAFSMTLLLPRPNVSMQDIVASLDPAAWRQIVESMTVKEGTVFLPRFRMEWGRELKGDLEAMGMEVPFMGGQADFSGLSDEAEGLYITKVRQKTFVDVDEEGTEAAGVTSVEMGRTSLPGHVLFRADRPFLFLI